MKCDGNKSQTGAKYDGEKLKKLMNSAKTTNDEYRRVVIPKTKKKQMSKKWKNLVEFLKKNGIPTSNPILLANGGFPNTGQMFIAREAGPELVGKIGNRNAVVNNDQIVSSVANGVAPAVYAAVKAAISESSQNGDAIVINLDGKKIAESTVRQVNTMTRQKGRNPIIGYT